MQGQREVVVPVVENEAGQPCLFSLATPVTAQPHDTTLNASEMQG